MSNKQYELFPTSDQRLADDVLHREGQETLAAKTHATDNEDEPYIIVAMLLKHVTPKDVPFVVEVIVNGMAAINHAKNHDKKEAVDAGAPKSSSAEEETTLSQLSNAQQEPTQLAPFNNPTIRSLPGGGSRYASEIRPPRTGVEFNVPQAEAARPHPSRYGQVPDHGFATRDSILNPPPNPWNFQ